MVTGDTTLKVAASLSKFAVRTGSAAPEETKTAQEATAPAEAASTEEASAAESTTEYESIEYPIEGDHSFTMTFVKRMNVAEALGEKDYSSTISYEALEEATGVHIDFEMLAETSYEETLNLRMASQDYPDIFSQSVASYQQKLEKAIDEDILIDFNDYLEYAPDWANLLERNETDRENITNSDLDSAAEYGLNFSAQGFKMLSFQLKEPGSTEVISGVATEEYVDYLEYLHGLYEEGLITDDAIEAIDLWSTAGDSTMTIPQAAQPGGDDMMEIFTMASDSLTYLSTVAPKVILGTATADDYRAAVEECMNGMNLDVITERYQAAYDAFMGN